MLIRVFQYGPAVALALFVAFTLFQMVAQLTWGEVWLGHWYVPRSERAQPRC